MKCVYEISSCLQWYKNWLRFSRVIIINVLPPFSNHSVYTVSCIQTWRQVSPSSWWVSLKRDYVLHTSTYLLTYLPPIRNTTQLEFWVIHRRCTHKSDLRWVHILDCGNTAYKVITYWWNVFLVFFFRYTNMVIKKQLHDIQVLILMNSKTATS